MKPSPVQLLQLTFRKVSIELDERHVPDEPPNPLLSTFSFEGVTLKTNIGFGKVEDAPAQAGSVFQLTFDLFVENEEKEGAKDQRFSPYLIDVRASALIRVPVAAEVLGPARDLGIVNGAALVWSALREQVANLTSRMPMGQVMLPTVHFHDLKSPEAQGATQTKRKPKAIAPAKLKSTA